MSTSKNLRYATDDFVVSAKILCDTISDAQAALWSVLSGIEKLSGSTSPQMQEHFREFLSKKDVDALKRIGSEISECSLDFQKSGERFAEVVAAQLREEDPDNSI